MRHACGLTIDADAFTSAELNASLDACEIEETEGKKDDKAITKPKKFDPIDWVSWKRSFETT